MTPAQLTTLAAAIAAETYPAFVAFRTAGATGAMADFYNEASAFIVRRKRVEASEIGPVLNYVAVSSLTVANRDRATVFLTLNPEVFSPTADIEAYWESTFGGALGGEGANTRAALSALWRRPATRGEALYATGTGSTASPGALVFEGYITNGNIVAAINL